MTRSRAILAATSIAAAAVLLVAGCDDDPPATPSAEPTATDVSPSASPSPSSSAVVVAPERPQEMDDDGPAGAEAAAVYFLELDDYMMRTGETDPFRTMSAKDCQFCVKRVDQAQEIQDLKYTWEGTQTRPQVTHTYEQDDATGIWPIDVEVTQKIKIVDAEGESVSAGDPKKLGLAFEVGQKDGNWVIVEVGQVDNG
ncbi:DUF6318 family protein [Isoptericola sp. NPDC056573]|uniref:DUF6318 family protein n=1 Tax=Isoptericola sp. NPDC056573 TaxID=3345868 RepID=UPI00368FC38B